MLLTELSFTKYENSKNQSSWI